MTTMKPFEQFKKIQIFSATPSTLQTSPNIAARLDEFRDMRNGWLEGEGSAPSPAGLDWLADSFTRHFPEGGPIAVCLSDRGRRHPNGMAAR